MVSMLECQRVDISTRADIWFEISAPPVSPCQLSYDKYIDHTLKLLSLKFFILYPYYILV